MNIEMQLFSASRKKAVITDRNITADFAHRTLQKEIELQSKIDLTKLLIHSDQGSQYTPKEYTEFCEKLGIARSMSKAGYPYKMLRWKGTSIH
jgi:hypothetical protein